MDGVVHATREILNRDRKATVIITVVSETINSVLILPIFYLRYYMSFYLKIVSEINLFLNRLF